MGDEWTARLDRLFREHPAWVSAAKLLSRDACSRVYFRQRPGEVWHLEQRAGTTRLRPGPGPDPDFVFRFGPEAIAALEDVDGGIGQFAVRLFALVLDQQVDLRIAAGFARLARRGYVKLLLAAGAPVLAFGAAHGVRDLGALGRLVGRLRAREPAAWEVGTEGGPT